MFLPRRTPNLNARGNRCDLTPWQTINGCRGPRERLVRRRRYRPLTQVAAKEKYNAYEHAKKADTWH